MSTTHNPPSTSNIRTACVLISVLRRPVSKTCLYLLKQCQNHFCNRTDFVTGECRATIVHTAPLAGLKYMTIELWLPAQHLITTTCRTPVRTGLVRLVRLVTEQARGWCQESKNGSFCRREKRDCITSVFSPSHRAEGEDLKHWPRLSCPESR